MSLAYLKGLETLTDDATAAWNAAGANYKGLLLNATHVEDETDSWLSDVNANEISQAPAHVVIASAAISINLAATPKRVELDCADFSFATVGAGDVPAFLVIYFDTGLASTSPLICSLTLGSPPTPDGGSWTAIIAASGAIHLQNGP